MHRKALGILVLTIAISLSFAACKQRSEGAVGAARKSVNWKMAGAYSSTTPIVGDSGPLWSKKLEHVSGGRLRIKYFDPGKLVPVLEIFDSVSKGAVDAGWTSAGYWIGKLPSAALFSAVPFGPNALEYMAWIYEGGGLDLWQEIYAENNIWVTPCVIIPPEASGWFREPIENVDQLRGMKIR
ncbi:MAG TPA: C4-dicarboxylate ABC transporter, partial [Candidatus Latescibacteria bacterium]|nr:C4-dicarboxylate ABC transporter [Candidatus Latescibacterota bacterium]